MKTHSEEQKARFEAARKNKERYTRAATEIDWDEQLARLADIFDELDKKYPRST